MTSRRILVTIAPFTKQRCLSSAAETPHLFQTLIQANYGILQQKENLIRALVDMVGATEAHRIYPKVCPIVQASVGQHIRHSMDHIDQAMEAAAASEDTTVEVHYDLRRRGGSDEQDWEAALTRIQTAQEQLLQLTPRSSSNTTSTSTPQVQAYFQLTGDSGSEQEYPLPSTVERELGFAMHHAIHHLAMVKIVARETWMLPDEAFPPNFGKAPSTVLFETHPTSPTTTQ